MSEPVATLVNEENRTLEPLYTASALAEWNANITGETRYYEENARLNGEIRKHFSDPARYEAFRKADEAGEAKDAVVARQVRLLRLAYLGNQSPPEKIEAIVKLEKALETRFNNFRAKLGGVEVTDNKIRDVLRHETDNAVRKAAWEASKQVGVVAEPDVRELARLRNAEARRLGYRDHFAMSLELQELDEKRLFETFETLHRLSEEPYTEYKRELDEGQSKRFGITPAQMRPWHYSDPFFQDPPSAGLSLDKFFEGKQLEPLAVAHYKGMGMEVRDILDRSDLYEKPGKCQHAFGLSVDRKEDVRMLCNLVPNERWLETLLHELGHAVYDKYLDRSLPYLLRMPAHILSTEAIAMLNGRFTRSDEWLIRRAGVPEGEARELSARLKQRLGQGLMILTRWVSVMTHFERDLYADPDGNLNPRWWDYVERFQRVTRPEGRNAPDWAAKIHLAVAPVYYQNYLLGEMRASQLSSYIAREVVKKPAAGLGALVDRPEAGEFLRKKVFEPGARQPWEDHLQAATGEGLNPLHFVGQYRG